MDYALKVKNLDTFEKIKELIAFRKATPALRLATRDEINARVKDVKSEQGSVSFTADDLIVIHTVNGTALQLDGEYEILYSNVRDEYGTVSGTFTAGTNESAVLRKVG